MHYFWILSSIPYSYCIDVIIEVLRYSPDVNNCLKIERKKKISDLASYPSYVQLLANRQSLSKKKILDSSKMSSLIISHFFYCNSLLQKLSGSREPEKFLDFVNICTYKIMFKYIFFDTDRNKICIILQLLLSASSHTVQSASLQIVVKTAI